MAFSNLQKKQLTLMIDSPKEFKQQCENGKINLKDFREQFFKDGTGIFHLLANHLMIQRDIEAYPNHFDLFKYILEQDTRLSMFQETGRTNSAFKELADFAKTSSKLNTVITSLLLKQKYINPLNYYPIRDFVCSLAEQGFYKEVDDIIKLPKVLDSELVNNLLNIAIETNSSNFLDYLLIDEKLKPILKDEIGSYFFPLSKKFEEKEFGNIYLKCIKNQNYNALFKIMESYSKYLSSSGVINSDTKRYSNPNWFRKDVHPLDLILEKGNKEHFDKFYSFMTSIEKAVWFSSQKGQPPKLYKLGFEDIVLQDLNNLFSEEVPSTYQLGTYNNLLSFAKELMESNKYQKIDKILEPLWNKIPNVNKATIFRGVKPLFDNFYSNGNMSDKEIKAFTNIFKKIVERGEFQYTNKLFSTSFFNEPKLVENLLDAGLKIDILPTDRFIDSDIQEMKINIFEHYLHTYDEYVRNVLPKANPLKLENAKQTLSIIYKHSPELIFNETTKKESLLKLAIKGNCGQIFEMLNIEDFNKFVKIDGISLLESINNKDSMNDENKNYINILVEKLLKTSIFDDYKSLNNTKKLTPLCFYHLLGKELDTNLLDKVYNIAGIDLNKEIQKTAFWQIANNKYAREFLKERVSKNIDHQNLDSLVTFATSPNEHHKYLLAILDVIPDFYKIKMNGNNLLHITAKNDAYLKNIKLVTLYPELAKEVNNQNNLPIVYMLDTIEKQLNKKYGYGPGDVHMNAKEAFTTLLPHSISLDKKANKIFEQQLQKHPSIKEMFKDIIVVYEYEKLKEELPLNNSSQSKKLKI